MIRFVAPEAFLLVPLVALALRRRLWPRPLLGTVRVLVLLLFAGLLAHPYLQDEADGRDLVLVVDRSRSMPSSSSATVQEVAGQLGAAMQPGDRIGVVTFGRKPAVELVPTAPFRLPKYERPIEPDGSDLAAAITAAAALVPPGRPGSLLVVSDGESTTGDLDAAARAALRAGLRIDCLAVPGAVRDDAAVIDVQAPGEAALGAPFVLNGFAFAGAAGKATWKLLEDGALVASGELDLQPGRNLLQFRRAMANPGVHVFALEIAVPGDPTPENDRGQVAVRAVARDRVLCITPGGREDRLVGSLRAAGLEVAVAAPGSAALSLDALDGLRAVVLEDVPASDLPAGALSNLRAFVRDLGGGLLMTGGKASFGVGGWHRSPVEEVLPVTMEMRDEQRRFSLAMAIALDRSGSMQAPAGNGTKMDLADMGAATAVELLSARDSVAVIAVDSAAHIVVPMQPVADKPGITAKVRRIESMGGGIYVGAALKAAARELASAPQKNKHLVLFADAADAEEPEDYQTFVPGLVAAGVTVSVIGLGTDADSDAALLREIAELGKGRCQFVADPTELPRVFAQETIQVSKSAIVEEPAAVQVFAALRTLGGMPTEFPQVGGYSLAWRRPRAELGLQTIDQQQAPLLSWWQCGLGRAAAFLGEVDGPVSGGLATWDGYAEFFGTLLRWLSGGASEGVFTEFRREGEEGLLSVEVEATAAAALDRARGVIATPDGQALDVVWQRTAPARLVAKVPLRSAGVYRGAVQMGDVSVRVPPLCLPYSPEFAPRLDARAGERALRLLADTTGGRLDPTAAQALEGPRRAPGLRDLSVWCAFAGLVLFLLEIALRRFDVRLPVMAWPRRRSASVAKVAEPARVTPAIASGAAATGAASAAVSESTPVQAPSIAPPQAPPAKGGDLLMALERAKKRGQR
jgi:uncharacterized membrane protein